MIVPNPIILVIDDQPRIHKDIEKVLNRESNASRMESLGAVLFGDPLRECEAPRAYDLVFETQGQDGFEVFKREIEAGRGFAMAIVDMHMPPGWSGATTIRRLRGVEPSVRVVLCSAYSARHEEQLGDLEGPPIPFLRKPFEIAELETLVVSELDAAGGPCSAVEESARGR